MFFFARARVCVRVCSTCRWVRQLQEACAGSLEGMSVTVTPEGLPGLLALLNAGSATCVGMRDQALHALSDVGTMFGAATPAPASRPR